MKQSAPIRCILSFWIGIFEKEIRALQGLIDERSNVTVVIGLGEDQEQSSVKKSYVYSHHAISQYMKEA